MYRYVCIFIYIYIYIYMFFFAICLLPYYFSLQYITLHYITLDYITSHYIIISIIFNILYLSMSEWIVMTPWCFSHVRQFRKGILSNCIKLGEMQCLHRCWPFGRDVTNSFQPSCEQIVPAIFQGPKRYIFYTHYQGPLRSKPDICGPFKSIFFQPKKKQVTYVQIRLGVKRTQDFLSLLPRKFSVYCVV